MKPLYVALFDEYSWPRDDLGSAAFMFEELVNKKRIKIILGSG